MTYYTRIQARTILAEKISEVVSRELPFSYYSGGHNDINTNTLFDTGQGDVYHIENFNNIRMGYDNGQLTTYTGSLSPNTEQIDFTNKTIWKEKLQFTNAEFFETLESWTECLKDEGTFILDADGVSTGMQNYTIDEINSIQVVTYYEEGDESDYPYPILKQIAWPTLDCQALALPIYGNHIVNSGLLAQNISINNILTMIDNSQANEVLDTHIHELLPPSIDRGFEIGKFFADYNKLKGTKPSFDEENGFCPRSSQSHSHLLSIWRYKTETDRSIWSNSLFIHSKDMHSRIQVP